MCALIIVIQMDIGDQRESRLPVGAYLGIFIVTI